MSIRDATFTARKTESNEAAHHAELISSSDVFLNSQHEGAASIFCDSIQGRDWPVLGYVTKAREAVSNAVQEHAELVSGSSVFINSDHISAQSIFFNAEGYLTHGLAQTIVEWRGFWDLFLRLLAVKRQG